MNSAERTDVLLNITRPSPWGVTYAQPRIQWYSLTDLPHDAIIKVVVKHTATDALWSFDAPPTGDFVVPVTLEDGEYRVRVRAIDRHTKEQVISRYVTFRVDPAEAGEARIACNAPWRHLFLMGKNRVRPCCNLKEGVVFPTDPTNSQEDLWNNRGMVELRDALLAGDDKFCHPHCPDLGWARDGAEPSRVGVDPVEYERGHLVSAGPRSLKLSLGSHCNHKCTFCKMGSVQYNHWRQTESSFNYLARNISQVETVTFTGGEPLVHMKGAEARLTEAFASVDDLHVALQTNGALVDRYMDLLTAIPTLSLSVSMAGANRDDYLSLHRVDDFDRVCDNLAALKQARGSRPTFIELKMVYTRQNYLGIADFPEVARRVGATQIYFHHLMILSKTDIDPADEILDEDDEWAECLDLMAQARVRCDEYGISMRVTAREHKKVREFNSKAAVTVDENEEDLG